MEWKVPEVLECYWPGGVFGVDRECRPCLYQLSKQFDTQGSIAVIYAVRGVDI